MTPQRLRDRGAGETIRYTTAATTLGVLLVAATERGICSIALADDEATAVAQFGEHFARAERIADADRLHAHVAAIVASIDGDPAPLLALPLDLAGTAFARRVWNALRTIPAGSTRTYAQIAEQLGARKSARAVARACATNAIALAIPCHRVIRSDGNLAGYRWGIARKERLLAREAAARAPRGTEPD